MRRYRFVIVTEGHVAVQVENLSCPDDETAKILATTIAGRASMVEVWHISRMVGVSFHTPVIISPAGWQHAA